MAKDKELIPTPPRALNALGNLLKDILDGLITVELFAGRGVISKRFLKAGAQTAVCIDNNPPEEHEAADGMVWLEMDALQFLDEERVQNVGLIYSAPPPGSDYNRQILEKLPELNMLADNCLVILEEPTWSQTPLQNYPRYSVVETYEFGTTRIVVTQMVELPV